MNLTKFYYNTLLSTIVCQILQKILLSGQQQSWSDITNQFCVSCCFWDNLLFLIWILIFKGSECVLQGWTFGSGVKRNSREVYFSNFDWRRPYFLAGSVCAVSLFDMLLSYWLYLRSSVSNFEDYFNHLTFFFAYRISLNKCSST